MGLYKLRFADRDFVLDDFDGADLVAKQMQQGFYEACEDATDTQNAVFVFKRKAVSHQFDNDQWVADSSRSMRFRRLPKGVA